MSYCRFSSDDPRSDIYCHEADAGYVIHVAKTRAVIDAPLPPRVPHHQIYAWLARDREVRDLLSKAPRPAIGLAHDGETFTDATAAECADRLEYLRALGYHVPQYAIDSLREEAEEEAQ